ncbi:MAG: hypothetical protein DWQ04_34235 [Chloroflexi bacterium]|nr:MAG: hypothetical protein DWQ04_34235 [Chloroflexota bacterium]
MKKTEEQLANELDAFLTAHMEGTSPDNVDMEQTDEAKLATHLLILTEQTEPEPAFTAQLESRLTRMARTQQKKADLRKRPSFWQQLDHWIKEQLIMKKTIYALGGLAVFVLIGIFAWNALRPAPESTQVAEGGDTAVTTDTPADSALSDVNENTEDTQPADETTAPETTDDPTEVAALPPLPKIEGGGQARGLGGGGAAETAVQSEALPATADLMIDPYFTDVFSGTQFVANTTLPTDIAQALVWQQASLSMELAEAQQIATAFGFTGPLYVMPQPVYVDEAGVERVDEIPVTYFVFDGSRALTIDAYGTYYRDESVSFDFEEQLPLEQITPIAEAFVTANGLVDFPYEMDRLWGNEVLFYRLIDGLIVNQPEVTVSINDQGEIAFASNQKLRNLAELGNYPLRTAEEAFQVLQSGIVENNIWYTYTPTDLEGPIPTEPFVEPFDEYRNWQRTYQPGDEAHLYTWPNIYLPADGSGAPRIETWPFSLAGSEEMLNEIAANANQQFHFWGVVGEDGKTLTLTGWEAIDNNREPIWGQGTIRRDGDQVLFESETGDIYLVPNAPEDLPENEALNIFGWALRDIGAAYPAIDWENIDVFIEYPEEPIGLEEPVIVDDSFIYEPTIYQQIDITGVELIYAYSYIYPEFEENASDLTRIAQMPTTILQPAWKFTGTADNGDEMEFVVEAVAPEYVETP